METLLRQWPTLKRLIMALLPRHATMANFKTTHNGNSSAFFFLFFGGKEVIAKSAEERNWTEQ